MGDENSSFFHCMATISHEKKFIVSLIKPDGTSVTEHEQKANLLWSAYKQRLGCTEFTDMAYDLTSLLTQHDLDHLDLDFSQEEIDLVIKSLPNSHAPGPDGFNGFFINKSWNIIKNDFIRLIRDFSNFNIDLRCINSSIIALVPKKSIPESVDDFRPISLLNYSLNCITKLLSTRLQSVILQLVHQNQYGFIKGRTIQDCLVWAFQFLHIYHKSKKEIIILKIEFAKAFDKLEHQVILQILRSKGFSEKWIGWINNLLSTASSSVLLNTIPGKSFNCLRGVRQGDPLSPLLFVLAADLCQSIINKAWQAGVLKHPLADDFGGDFPMFSMLMTHF